jgi:hypothetical protein
MTVSAPAAGSTPAPKSLVARIIGIIVSPKETFQSVVASPKWLGVLALTVVLAAIFASLPMTTPGGKQAWLDQQVQARRAFGQQTDDAGYAQLEKVQPFLPYITAGAAIVFGPIMVVILSAIFFAVMNAGLGGEASFKQVFSVVTHAGVISVLGAVFGGSVNYFRQRMDSITNLGGLLPMLPEKSFLAHFLGTIDLFIIWWVIVLAIGLAVLYRRRTQPIAITLFSLYGVIALGIAVFKSRGA